MVKSGVLGKVLSVEKANEDKKPQQIGVQVGKDFPQSASSIEDAYLAKDLNQGSRSIPTSEPIAPRLGVDCPFPPHLKNVYPPLNGNILTNIVNAFIAVPRFYTQVLHLMNKMNIPAPFRIALPMPRLPPSEPAPQLPPPPPLPGSTPAKPHLSVPSSSESEMESSDEELNDKSLTKSAWKRSKREAIVGPAIEKNVAHEAVGVKPSTLIPKVIPLIRKKNPVLQIKISPKNIPNEQKNDDDNKQISEEINEEDPDAKEFATVDELEKGELPPEEILSLPMFKNYTAGNPASVLYIKNLAKDVVPEDFFFIFGSLFGSIDAARAGINIKLMQEGRVKGQAFVTFPSVELAHHALNVVNGYVFKGKAIIIQFGQNPETAKTN